MYEAGLTTSMLLSHAEANHGDTEIVSVDVKGSARKVRLEIGR